jgi:hypothetical protein
VDDFNDCSSLPGLTRQSIPGKTLAKKMDARVKPAHDETICYARQRYNLWPMS